MLIKKYISWNNIILFVFCLIVGSVSGYICYLKEINLAYFLGGIVLLMIGLVAIQSVTLSLYLFLFSLPLDNIGEIQVGIPLKLYYVFFFFFLVALFIDKNHKEIGDKKFIQTPLDIPLFLFIGIIIISIFQSIYIPANPPIIGNKFINYPWIKSIVKLGLLMGCLCIYYACVYVLSSKQKIKQCVFAQTVITMFFSIFTFFCFLTFLVFKKNISLFGHPILIILTDDLPRIVGTEQEPLFFGLYLLTILPILYSFLFAYIGDLKESFIAPPILLFSVILNTAVLFLTGARSAILGFLISFIILFFLYKQQATMYEYSMFLLKKIWRYGINFFSSKTIRIFCIVCILIGGIYSGIYWNTLESIGENIVVKGVIIPIKGTFDRSMGKYWSTRTRMVAYDYALTAFKQHPWLGIGYENFNFYSGNKVYLQLLDFNMNWPEVNNYPLKILTEEGIIGFFSFLLCVLIFFYFIYQAIIKTKDIFIKNLLKGYVAVFIGISVVLLFSSNITKPYLWVALSISIAAINLVSQENKIITRKEQGETI